MVNDWQLGNVVGRIRRRLLVNQWVDPDEVGSYLPVGVRPHVGSNGGVIVGCCMIEIGSARPWPLPSQVGIGLRAAAHRISVEVGPERQPTPAVWVPIRHTDSVPVVAVGGRLFPGVHAKADVSVGGDGGVLSWSVAGSSDGSESFDIDVSARIDRADDGPSEVADIVIGTALGLSPGRSASRVEAVEMVPAHQQSCVVEVVDLESAFMAGFSSAKPAETLLMTDVDVTWRRTKLSGLDRV